MIQYNKGAYGINLLLRIHGSALYRAMLPGLLSVGIFLIIDQYWRRDDPDDDLNHPYGIGILVSSVSFLIIFRANYGYQRYWEACGAVHHMMSKWMDATIHTGVFHLQCSHYDGIKPPSYFDFPELNRYNLTRNRECTGEDDFSEGAPTRPTLLSKPSDVSVRSINLVADKKKNTALDEKAANEAAINSSSHLLGPGRPDGGWGMLYPDGTATYYSSKVSVDTQRQNAKLDGFASTGGGRTPSLFLQELAHLASLCNAVALSTLRNDIEDAESPLGFYEPGSPWPPADPGHIPSGTKGPILLQFSLFLRNVKYWLGMDRTPEARTKYNASRPMPVLGGVSDNEITFLQRARGPSAKTTLAWSWLSEFITREHLSGSTGKVGPPIISRLIQFLSDGMIYYNHARKIMYIPFPFPHAQLSAFYVLTMIPTVPFLMDQYTNETWLGSLLTFLTITCLAGLHEVARELENPFRNVPNDIPLCTLQAMFNESLVTLYAGYHPDHYWDGDEYLERAKGKEMSRTKRNDHPSIPENSPVVNGAGKSQVLPVESVPQSTKGGRNTFSELQQTVAKQSQEIERLRSLVEGKNDEGKNPLCVG